MSRQRELTDSERSRHQAEAQRRYYEKNKERLLKYQKDRLKASPELQVKHKRAVRAYYHKFRDKILGTRHIEAYIRKLRYYKVTPLAALKNETITQEVYNKIMQYQHKQRHIRTVPQQLGPHVKRSK